MGTDVEAYTTPVKCMQSRVFATVVPAMDSSSGSSPIASRAALIVGGVLAAAAAAAVFLKSHSKATDKATTSAPGSATNACKDGTVSELKLLNASHHNFVAILLFDTCLDTRF